MVEAEPKELTPTQTVSLFVKIPEVRIKRGEEDSIRNTFDGSYKDWGISIDLDLHGYVSKAKLYNLVNGKIRGYELNNEGNWRSKRGPVEQGTEFDKTLRAVAQFVQEKYREWKKENLNPSKPISRWTMYRAKLKINSPEDWYIRHPLTEEEKFESRLRRI